MSRRARRAIARAAVVVIIAAAPAYGQTVVSSEVVLQSTSMAVSDGFLFDGGMIRLVGSWSTRLGAHLQLPDTQSMTGTGTVQFEGPNNTIAFGNLTVRPNVTIRNASTGGDGTLGNAWSTLINQGTIAADGGGTIWLVGAWKNQGTLRVSGGDATTLILDGTYATADLGTFQRTGGNLIFDGNFDNRGRDLDLARFGGPVTLSGAIAGGTLRSSTPVAVRADGATLDAVTVDTDLGLDHSEWFTVTHGLTLQNRTIAFTAGGGIAFAGPQTLGGTGEIVVNGRPSSSGYETVVAGDALTIGPGITVRTGARPADTDGALQIGEVYSTIVNQGTISSQTPGMSVNFRGAWANQGTIRVSDGWVSLGGTFTPNDVGTFQRTGGTVYLDGTVSGPGQTLTLNASTGSWVLRQGTINGVRVRTDDGTQFQVWADSEATFSGATTAGQIVALPGSQLGVKNGLTLTDGGTITLMSGTNSDHPTMLSLYGDQTVGGTGEIVFDGPGNNSRFRVFTGSNFTFGPGVTIRTGTGGGAIQTLGIPTAITIQGPVVAGPGGRLTLSGVNLQGSLTAGPGSNLLLGGGWQNNGSITMSHGTLTLVLPVASYGAFSIDASTIELAGPFTSAQANAIPRINSPFALVTGGVISNTGGSIELSSLAGGKVVGGAVTAAPGGLVVRAGVTGSTLDAVTVASDLSVAPSATLNVTNGLTVGPGARLSLASGPGPTAPTFLLVAGTQGLSGTGAVTFDGTTQSSFIRSTTGTLKVGVGLTVRTGTQGGSLGQAQFPLQIDGAVSAETAGKTLNVAGSAVTNNGTLSASSGGLLTVVTASFTNAGTITVGPGSTFTLAGPGPLGGGAIDVAGGHAVFARWTSGGWTPAGLRPALLAGRNGGDWTGPGIRSSVAAADVDRRVAVGYIEASALLGLTGSQVTLWGGAPVNAESLLIACAVYGDANFDGRVDADDYALVDRGLMTGGQFWMDGDFDYSGTVDATDYFLIDREYGLETGQLSATLLADRAARFGEAYVSELIASVPEPSVIGIVSAALMLAGRRNRRLAARV